ncbi:MAG: YtxH domain-containing protein [Gemmatimonadales bacterium]
MARDEDREVVYLVRESEAPLKHLFLGAVLGAGLALLFAPATGEETRRSLRRRAGELRVMAEEGFDDLEERLTDGTSRIRERVRDTVDDVRTQAEEVTEAVKGAGATAREELERRLADARARRRGESAELDEAEEEEEEEPVA